MHHAGQELVPIASPPGLVIRQRQMQRIGEIDFAHRPLVRNPVVEPAQLTALDLYALETPLSVVQILPRLEWGQHPRVYRQKNRVQTRAVVTAFQAQQIYAGKGKALWLGNYRLLEKLGQGGMGMVLKAEHRRMKRLVAVKILSPAVVKSPEAVKRFQREVEAAAKLIHPNIVTAFDADESNGTHFLVMEFVPGRDLASVVATEGPLPISRAIDCMRQAARGLAFAHQNIEKHAHGQAVFAQKRNFVFVSNAESQVFEQIRAVV